MEDGSMTWKRSREQERIKKAKQRGSKRSWKLEREAREAARPGIVRALRAIAVQKALDKLLDPKEPA